MKLPEMKIVEAIGGLTKWAHNCHACSLAIVRTGLLPQGARVARGSHPLILSQHSWVVIGDPYAKDATILDGTLWSYVDTSPVFLIGTASYLPHRPNGAGSIWDAAPIPRPTRPPIPLSGLSNTASAFLKMLAPKGMDALGWGRLANCPVGGWPATEIIGAMYDNAMLRPLVPIDRVGMLTDRNPQELYF